MAAPKTQHQCTSCGHTQRTFFGQCPACKEWGTSVEVAPDARGKAPARSAPKAAFSDLGDVSADSYVRTPTGISELDRVLGGGVVPGSYIVLSAEPGQGKSTIASQILAGAAAAGRKVALLAAEESPAQVKMRFERLGSGGHGVDITADPGVEHVISSVLSGGHEMLVVDSIQTVVSTEQPGTPGSVGQVRESGQALMRLAKEHGVTVLLIGQVTKEGSLAGPRMLEHMVDVVLHMEGDRDQQLRVLRAIKNRFGSTDEIGVFSMTSSGLEGVPDPSAALGVKRTAPVAGAMLCPVIEGSRPLLVEVQALVSPTSMSQPIRAARGFDPKRFQMLLAVLSRKARLRLGSMDIFCQIAGGMRVDDPALDLAVCMAVASAARGAAPADAMGACGEVSLLGEVRPAPQAERRLAEFERIGYRGLLSAPGVDTLERAISHLGPAGLEEVPEETSAEAA